MALNVIMMGPPGAGKGTQAARLARERGVPKISTGDIFRQAIVDGTPMGLQAQATMARGELVADDIVIGIVRERLQRADTDPGFVLDGFPRTVPQAGALDEIVAQRNSGPLIVVKIVVPELELVRRLAGRRICATCGANADGFDVGVSPERCRKCGGQLVQRSDDDEHVVRERLKVYQRDTRPLVDYYRHRPTFRFVNGAQPPERVHQELVAMIDSAATLVDGAAVPGKPLERLL